MATKDIYETGFDEDVQTDSSTNQCPEYHGHVTTKIKETIYEECGLVIEENASIMVLSGGRPMRTSASEQAHR